MSVDDARENKIERVRAGIDAHASMNARAQGERRCEKKIEVIVEHNIFRVHSSTRNSGGALILTWNAMHTIVSDTSNDEQQDGESILTRRNVPKK